MLRAAPTQPEHASSSTRARSSPCGRRPTNCAKVVRGDVRVAKASLDRALASRAQLRVEQRVQVLRRGPLLGRRAARTRRASPRSWAASACAGPLEGLRRVRCLAPASRNRPTREFVATKVGRLDEEAPQRLRNEVLSCRLDRTRKGRRGLLRGESALDGDSRRGKTLLLRDPQPRGQPARGIELIERMGVPGPRNAGLQRRLGERYVRHRP